MGPAVVDALGERIEEQRADAAERALRRKRDHQAG